MWRTLAPFEYRTLHRSIDLGPVSLCFQVRADCHARHAHGRRQLERVQG